MSLRCLVKTHGGKSYCKDFILSLFPDNYQDMVYCEPFIGGGPIFLNKQPSKVEFISDIDNGLMSIWQEVSHTESFPAKLQELIYSQETFDKALTKEFRLPINEYVLRRMSRGGLKKNFAWSNRLRGNRPGDLNSWYTAIEQLPLIRERIKNTYIKCINAFAMIHILDHPNTLLYLDPPYLKSTRTAHKTYEFDFNEVEHVLLLDSIKDFKGKVLISGYNSDLYNQRLVNWIKFEKSMPNHSGQGKTKERRTEVVWRNF